MIREVEKGRTGRLLLAHEKHRRVGDKAKEKRQGAPGFGRDGVMQALAKRAVAHLVMVGDAVDEMLGREMTRRRATWLGELGVRLATEEPAML